MNIKKEGAATDYLGPTKQIVEELRCMDKCEDYGRKMASDFMRQPLRQQTESAKTTLEYFGYRNQDAGQRVSIFEKKNHFPQKI